MKSSFNILTAFLFSLFLIFSVARADAQNPDDQAHIRPHATPTPTPAPEPTPGPNEAIPQSQPYRPPFPGDPEPSGGDGGESSSKDSQIDLGAHPLLAEPSHPATDESVFVPFDPHRAAKDVEIGGYYLKLKNYRAALDRFHDALLYKPNDADAMYGLAVTQERLDLLDQADQSYRKYLQILPNGPKSSDAQEALKRIGPHLSSQYQATKTGAGNLDPSKQAAHDMDVGESYLSINKYDAARERFEEALRLAPENPLVYFRLAQSLQGMQRLDPARLYYRKYLELEPKGRYMADARKAIKDIDFIMGK